MNKIKNYRWHMIALVCFITVINYLDRTALGIAAPTIMETTGITKEQYSWIVSAFQLAYTLGQPIMGFFIDTMGLKLSFAICAAIWGLATMGHALTGTWSGLAFMRALMGFSEASAIPAGVKTASTWFPAKERGVATGVFNMGTSLGAMLAPPLIAWCIMFHSWQFAFIVSGSLALLAALFWFFCYKDPKDAKRLSDEERHYIESGQEQHLKTDKKEKTSIRIFMRRNYLILLAGVIPACFLLGVWIAEKIGPFGGNSLTMVDSLHQYLPFFSDYYDKLKNEGSLFYTWDIGLGSNMLAIIAYYIACPINFLVVLFKREHIYIAMSLFIGIKIVLSGMSFAYYMREKCRNYKTYDAAILIFSTAYAISNYVIGYSWNLMWMDCIMILPLIMAGFERMTESGDYKLYKLLHQL